MSNRTSHAYIVLGGTAQSAFTQELIIEMLGAESRTKVKNAIHPDVLVVSLEINKNTNKMRTEITVGQIRDVMFSAAVMPNEALRTVIVIETAHLMNANAQNAFLKTLEEPPEHVRIILVTDEPNSLLATVRSRCVVLDSAAAETAAPQHVTQLAEAYFDALAQGDAALVELSFTLDKTERVDFEPLFAELLRLAAALYRAGRLSGDAVPPLRERVRRARELAERNVAGAAIAAVLTTV